MSEDSAAVDDYEELLREAKEGIDAKKGVAATTKIRFEIAQYDVPLKAADEGRVKAYTATDNELVKPKADAEAARQKYVIARNKTEAAALTELQGQLMAANTTKGETKDAAEKAQR